jgi:hypothetical protein
VDEAKNQRRPRKGDAVVAILGCHPTEEEIRRVEEKASWLRSVHRVNISERTRETWLEFQSRYRFDLGKLLRGLSLTLDEMDEAQRQFATQDLFWLVLHHFLRPVGADAHADPMAQALGRRLDRLPDVAQQAGLDPDELVGVLLELSKASNWGVVEPQVALTDWVRHWRTRHPVNATAEAAGASDGSSPAASLLSADQMQSAIARLKDWAAGNTAPIGRRGPRSPELDVSRIMTCLEHEGLLQMGSIKGETYLSAPHQLLARHILLEALNPDQPIAPALRADIGNLLAILDKDRAFEGFQTLLSALSTATANIRLCEELSERLLLGDEEEDWSNERAERRLAAYQRIPQTIRERSRVLSHHYAILLRRSTFAPMLSTAPKVERLLLAQETLRHSLSLPWAAGERSDHPAYIRTTLGLVLRQLAHFQPETASKRKEQARAELRLALLDLPASRHARLALARLCLEDVQGLVHSDPPQAAALAAECLCLLSVDPTGQHFKWHQTRFEAADAMGSDFGRQFLDKLCADGVEDGFLLKAELTLIQHADLANRDEGLRQAIAILAPRVRGNDAAARPRTCRRLVELMSDSPLCHNQYAERYRLLSIVEAMLKRTTPHEEFQLAWLAYQMGQFGEGQRRFTQLRAMGRASVVAGVTNPYLVNHTTRKPLRCRGKVTRLEGSRGWMQMESDADGRRLFDVPFYVRHFGDVAIGRAYPALVRFTEKGPTGVPERFAEFG